MSTDAKGPRSTPPRSHDDPESRGPEGQAVTSAEVQDSPPVGDKPSSPLEEARTEITRVREQLLRTAADFDNFRKRTRRELEDATRRGSEDLLRELLPVFDNLERAVQHAGTATDAKAVADGVGMVLKQFTDSLGRAGVRRVETIGKSFDPAQHEAIQQVETTDQPPGTIVAEVQPGYAMGERLIRAALVVVAKPPQAGNGSPPPSSVSAS